MQKIRIAYTFLGILCSSSIFAVPSNASNSTAAEMTKIADDYQQAFFERHPEVGLQWGRTDVAMDRFKDRSVAAQYQWQKKEDQFLHAIQQLNQNELIGTPQHQTYLLLKEHLQNKQDTRICREELWDVNPQSGWHNFMSNLADKQPVGSAVNRANALKRWRTFDKVVNEEIGNLKLGLRKGYAAPKPAVQRVLKQLEIVTQMPTEKSPFFEFASRDGDPEFKKQTADMIETIINPALKRYADFLQNEYLPKARDKVGVSALPNGVQCYKAKVKKNTTLTIEPGEIHAFGLQHMQQLYKEVADIGRQEFGITNFADVIKLGKEKTKQFSSEQEIIDYNYAALAKANAKVPQWFGTIPKAQGAIKPFPLHRAQTGAPGEYHRPSADGSRPGTFYINTYDPANKSRLDQEAVLYHELVPGHHFQDAIAAESTQQHPFEQYLWNAGFGEGWALYVERLADEMGLYEDNMSRLGMLANESLRTARLVVDPGIHVMGWTRDEALAYLKKHSSMDERILESEVDRYIMLPAQATSYMLGKREIDSLRRFAQAKLAREFDIRAYHDAVLKNGPVTLPMLRNNIHAWVELKANP